jgi:6-phosphogluconolactonase
MPTRPHILIAGDGQAWTYKAAALIRKLSEEAIASAGRCLLALSGGSTPTTLYHTLTTPEWRQQLQWRQMRFLFGDERCVPPDHPESNFGAAQRALFRPLAIDPHHVYRMKGESEDPTLAAREYEATLRHVADVPPPGFPTIDLILLGLGDDGHTASLFPGSPALHDGMHAVAVTHSPKGIRLRLTLTLGVINRATVVLFLVTGSAKAAMVRAVLEPQVPADDSLPAALVKPESGRVLWMLDRSAAGHLQQTRS